MMKNCQNQSDRNCKISQMKMKNNKLPDHYNLSSYLSIIYLLDEVTANLDWKQCQGSGRLSHDENKRDEQMYEDNWDL